MKRLLAMIVLGLAVVAWPRVEAQRRVFTVGTPAEIAQARAMGLDHVRGLGQLKGIDGPNDLVVTDALVDRQSIAHTRVQQYYRGVPVLGGQAIAHMNADGAALDDTDNLLDGISVDPRPRLTAQAAIDIAMNDYGCRDCYTAAPKAELWIMRDQGVDRLTYRVELSRIDFTKDTALPVRFVDARSGFVVLAYDNLQTATGSSLYSGTVSIGTWQNPHILDYVLQNFALRIGTFDMMNTNNTYWPFNDLDDVWDSPNQRAGVDAHYGMEKYFGYLSSVFGRNGIDGSGGPFNLPGDDDAGTKLVTSLVHGSTNYNNAFWNGDVNNSYMFYGDGDGIAFGPLVSIDIAGHEMTHGVTQHTAGLIYQGESGALNESWSDVFGAMLERHVKGEGPNTWLLAEDAYTPATPGDALRYMDNPHRATNRGWTTDDDPDHYSERCLTTGTCPNTSQGDNGGVHVNSGIPNKAFYLLAKGGSHHLGGSMTGIGADDAARIWFSALTSYMTPSTDFLGARAATVQAATAIFGDLSTQVTAVKNAWCLVGVGACPASADLAATSVTPDSGTGLAQTFTLTYSDTAGVVADLTGAQVRFLPTDGAAGACVVHYKATTGQVRIQDDAGVWGAFTSFGAGTIANSYCSLDLATSTAVPSGNDLAMTLALTFTTSFGGPKSIDMRANSATGSTTGWVTRGSWTIGGTVQAISVTPNSATGGAQTFALSYSDSLGAAADLKSAQVRFGATNVATGVCTVMYNAITSQVRIQDDLGNAGPWAPLGSATPLSNSQCIVDLTQSSASPSGNDLTLNLRITFTPAFSGVKNIYMRGNSNYGSTSGWQTRGTFTVGAIVQATSVTPNSDTGAARTFTLSYSDSLGATTDLKSAQVRFATAPDVAAGVCTVMYNAITGQARLHDDLGNAGPWTPLPSASTLSNSQCSVDLSQSSATPSGTDLTLNLRIAFTAAMVGPKNIYLRANSTYGSTTGWVNRGTFTVAATVTANSITPVNTSGATQAFTMSFSDSEGVVADLKVARVRFQGATGPACIVDYNAMNNMVRIQRDDGTWSNYRAFGNPTPFTNSQCTVNLTTSSATPSGTDVTVTLDLAFKPAFAGVKNVDLRANSNVGSTSNWQNLGTWTVP